MWQDSLGEIPCSSLAKHAHCQCGIGAEASAAAAAAEVQLLQDELIAMQNVTGATQLTAAGSIQPAKEAPAAAA